MSNPTEIMMGAIIFVTGFRWLCRYLNDERIQLSSIHLLLTVAVCILGALLATHSIFHHTLLH